MIQHAQQSQPLQRSESLQVQVPEIDLANYRDDITEDEETWSDPPSDDNTSPEEHLADTPNHNPREQARPRRNQNLSSHQPDPRTAATLAPETNRPAQFNYKPNAGGQAVPYGDPSFRSNSNPFMPNNRFAPNLQTNAQSANQYTPSFVPPNQYNPHPASPYQTPPHQTPLYQTPSYQTPNPVYPATPHYPTGSYDGSDPWYANNYFPGGQYASATNSHHVNTYPYPPEPHFGNPPPSLPRHAPYRPAPTAPAIPPIIYPSLEFQLNRVMRELDEVRLDYIDKEQEDRRRTEQKRIEDAARRKKDYGKMKKHLERKAKTEVSEALQRGRTGGESDTRSDPGKTHLTHDTRVFPQLTRQMRDALLYLDDERDRDPNRILEEVVGMFESQRRQGGRSLYGGSTRSSVDGAIKRRLNLPPRALSDAGAYSNFRNSVEEVVIDVLRDLKIEEEEENGLSGPPPVERTVSDGYFARQGHQRTRCKQSEPSSTKLPTTSSFHQNENDYQELPSELNHPTNVEQETPTSSRRPNRYLSKTRSSVKDIHIPDAQQPLSPMAVDSGYSSPKTATNGATRDRLGNAPFDRRTEPPISEQYREREYERTPQRKVSQSAPKARRQGRRKAFEGIITSDESEDPGLSPRRPPAPYALGRGHPNLREPPMPMAPDSPFVR